MYIPKNYRDTLDFFSFALSNAPDFSDAPTKYVLTLDDVMKNLDSAVAGVAQRIKNPEAQQLFQTCREELQVTHQLYKDGKLSEARKRIQVARDFFKQAGKLRSNKISAVPVEDDGQPE